ncbi:MAG: hypothetical protein GX216_01205 [Methanomicrobiales archaeon]|nr:hypothetical protein [Methanomicrobiales archaeon]
MRDQKKGSVTASLTRYFSFSALHIQTAGYSSQARAGIVLAGDLQERIMGFVRREEPAAVEGEPEAGDAVLRELRAIRRLLEERKEYTLEYTTHERLSRTRIPLPPPRGT